MPPPVTPEDGHTTRVTTGDDGASQATGKEPATPEPIWDDEDTRSFYESLPDLRCVLSLPLYFYLWLVNEPPNDNGLMNFALLFLELFSGQADLQDLCMIRAILLLCHFDNGIGKCGQCVRPRCFTWRV